MAHPATYIAYRIEELGGNLKRAEVPWTDPKDGQVVVKVLACGVCASDDTVKYQIVPGGLPRVPGHEIVGEIAAVPASEKVWKVGQRVGSGWHGGHCHTCKSCVDGDFFMCEQEGMNGILTDGGYAEYATLRREAICQVPTDMKPSEVAPLFCAGVTVFNSLRNMNGKPGDAVAIYGIGGLGHLAIQYAHAMGFHTIAISGSDSKRDLAKQLGADEYINAGAGDVAKALHALGGVKILVLTAPDASVISPLLPTLQVNGTLLLLALTPGQKPEIDVLPLIMKRSSIRGWPSGTAADSRDTVEFSKQRGVHCLVQEFPLEKAQEAYEHRSKARFRAVIVPTKSA